MILAYRCAYCSQWNPSLKPRPQLAISYNNTFVQQNNHITSSETIEEITDEICAKYDSDTNESEHSEQKDLKSKIYILLQSISFSMFISLNIFRPRQSKFKKSRSYN